MPLPLCGRMQTCIAVHEEACARPCLELGELPDLLGHRLEQITRQLQLLQRRQTANAWRQVCEVVARQGQLLQVIRAMLAHLLLGQRA